MTSHLISDLFKKEVKLWLNIFKYHFLFLSAYINGTLVTFQGFFLGGGGRWESSQTTYKQMEKSEAKGNSVDVS